MKNTKLVVLTFSVIFCSGCGWDGIFRKVFPKQTGVITVLLVSPPESNIEVGKRDSNVVLFCAPADREVGVGVSNSTAHIISEEKLVFSDTADADSYCSGNKGWYAATRFLRVSADTGTGFYEIFLKSGSDTTKAVFKIGIPKTP